MTLLRQQHLLDLLFENESGHSRAVLIDRLGVHKSTISRDVGEPQKNGAFVEVDGIVQLVRDKYWVDVRLSAVELQALVLACRSLAVNLHWNLPFAAQALLKLAQGQEWSFPVLSKQIRETAVALEDHGTWEPRLASIMTTLRLAIERRRTVRIIYRSKSPGGTPEHRILPGRLEPYAAGRSVYLFGLDLGTERLRVLKVSRIISVQPLKAIGSDAQIDRLESFLDPKRFRNSWGIWVSDKPAQEVCLRFDSSMAARVKETRWHPTQTLDESPDGTLIWRAWIREPQEMLPWVRGWGPACEVVPLGNYPVATCATAADDLISQEEK